MNRFIIEEKANFEIVKIFELEKTSNEWLEWNELVNQEGMSLST